MYGSGNEQFKRLCCKAGATAKTSKGKVGTLIEDPNEDNEVRLRFADGWQSSIKISDLTEAGPAEGTPPGPHGP